MSTNIKVYISGPLTGVKGSELKQLYEDIGDLCREFGLDPYIPHHHTDPEKDREKSAPSVRNTDEQEVARSDLVIAYVGRPSIGVGYELAYARMRKIPIILLYERGKEVSKVPRGIPSVWRRISFRDSADALDRLRKIFEKDLFTILLGRKEVRKGGATQKVLRARK